ncbi:hypothetical protein Tco_0377148 [Tanacetum coccineum]
MANLEFCDTHNMVAYLKKIEGSERFYQIMDFLNSSHIRYALTENRTIYVSLIQQFWNTATARTLDNGEMEITATIDGKVKIVSEASIRRHVKLEDSNGISNLPTTEIFEQLALMCNMRRASKGYTGVDIPLFPTMLVQGPVVQGEGSTVLVESYHTPTSAPSTSQPPSSSPSRRTTRQEYVVPQPRSPTQTNVADEAASTGLDVKHGGAATTVTSLDAGQGSGNINKTPSMPHDSPLPRVHTLGSDEGIMQHNELMDLVTKLSDRVVKKLEKTVKTRQARRKAKIVVSDDEEDLKDPSKQGRKIAEIDQDPDISLVRHDVEVQVRHDMESDFEFTATEEVYTAKKGVSTVEPVSTAGASVSTAGASSAKDKGKAIMEEAETIQTKTKLQLEQERLGYEEALRLQAKINEEERVKADEEFAQRLQSEEREMYSEAKKARLLTELINKRKRYFATQRAKERRNKPLIQAQQRTYMRVHTFVPMKSESERVITELAAGSSKRDAEEELLMMIIVPEQGMNVEALQTKYPIIDWEIYTEGARKYWKIIRVGEFTLSSSDMLKGFSFFLQMGFTLILATLDGLDVGLLGDVIGEDDCYDDG